MSGGDGSGGTLPPDLEARLIALETFRDEEAPAHYASQANFEQLYGMWIQDRDTQNNSLVSHKSRLDAHDASLTNAFQVLLSKTDAATLYGSKTDVTNLQTAVNTTIPNTYATKTALDTHVINWTNDRDTQNASLLTQKSRLDGHDTDFVNAYKNLLSKSDAANLYASTLIWTSFNEHVTNWTNDRNAQNLTIDANTQKINEHAVTLQDVYKQLGFTTDRINREIHFLRLGVPVRYTDGKRPYPDRLWLPNFTSLTIDTVGSIVNGETPITKWAEHSRYVTGTEITPYGQSAAYFPEKGTTTLPRGIHSPKENLLQTTLKLPGMQFTVAFSFTFPTEIPPNLTDYHWVLRFNELALVQQTGNGTIRLQRGTNYATTPRFESVMWYNSALTAGLGKAWYGAISIDQSANKISMSGSYYTTEYNATNYSKWSHTRPVPTDPPVLTYMITNSPTPMNLSFADWGSGHFLYNGTTNTLAPITDWALGDATGSRNWTLSFGGQPWAAVGAMGSNTDNMYLHEVRCYHRYMGAQELTNIVYDMMDTVPRRTEPPTQLLSVYDEDADMKLPEEEEAEPMVLEDSDR